MSLEEDIEIPSKECGESVLPLWTLGLQNAREVQGSWIIGTAKDESAMEDVIDTYSRSLPCDFTRSSAATIEKKRLKCSAKIRILWQMKDIPCTGVPFSVTSHSLLKCSFAMNYKSKKTNKPAVCHSQDDSLEVQPEDDDSALGSDESCSSLCPANIIVKSVRRYTSFALPPNHTKKDKLFAVKDLRSMLESGIEVDVEEDFWLRFPLSSLHNHTFRGNDRLTHPLVRDKIRQLVSDEVTEPEVVQTRLNQHVRDSFCNHHIPPNLEDEAYYPSLTCIKNIIYTYLNRKKKRKNSDAKSADKDDKSIKKKRELQDVGESFCSESSSYEENVTSNHDTSEIALLKRDIGEKLDELRKVSRSLNDEQKLKDILTGITNVLVMPETHNGVRKEVFYLLNGDCIPKQDVINSADVFTYHDRGAQNTSNEQAVILTPELIKQLTETNQIVPSESCDRSIVSSTDSSYHSTGESSIGYRYLNFSEVTEPQSEFIRPPAATSVVYELQSLPGIEDDTQKNYVSL